MLLASGHENNYCPQIVRVYAPYSKVDRDIPVAGLWFTHTDAPMPCVAAHRVVWKTTFPSRGF